MSRLFERDYVKCPYPRARTYLSTLLRDFIASGTKQVLRLSIPLNSNGPNIEKDVDVTYGQGNDPMHFDEVWTVHWTPREGGLYPDFDGSLTVRADENFENSILELSGSYIPPLGPPGQVFDSVLGKHIASITARRLLRSLGEQMEQQYHDEEIHKERPPH